MSIPVIWFNRRFERSFFVRNFYFAPDQRRKDSDMRETLNLTISEQLNDWKSCICNFFKPSEKDEIFIQGQIKM